MTPQQKETIVLYGLLLLGSTVLGFSNHGWQGAGYNFGITLVLEVIFYNWFSRK